MNKWIGIIRLTKDAEIRKTPEGNTVACFGGACNRIYKQEGQPDADFFNFVAFGKTAETIERLHVGKGTKLLIEADVHNDNYEKDGVKHYGTQFVIRAFEFCESKSSTSAAEPENYSDEFMNIPDGLDEALPFN